MSWNYLSFFYHLLFYLESAASTTLTQIQVVFFLPVCSQSLRITPTYWSFLEFFSYRLTFSKQPYLREKHINTLTFILFLYFFQNNKNSLTNKRLLHSLHFVLYLQLKMKKKTCPFHLLLAPIPPRSSLSNLPGRLDKRVPGPIAVSLYEVYRLFNDWWHVILSRHH